jgi:hypothetical protein
MSLFGDGPTNSISRVYPERIIYFHHNVTNRTTRDSPLQKEKDRNDSTYFHMHGQKIYCVVFLSWKHDTSETILVSKHNFLRCNKEKYQICVRAMIFIHTKSWKLTLKILRPPETLHQITKKKN